MVTSRSTRLAVAGLSAVAAGAVAGLPASASPASDAAAQPTAVVARAALQDTKAVLTTTRVGHLQATVRLTVLRRTPAGWHSTGTLVVGKRAGWFWFVTSGPHSVCGFSVSNTPRRAVAVRLLTTPSIGCAATARFHVENGRLVAG
jgi:hypothetical protein